MSTGRRLKRDDIGGRRVRAGLILDAAAGLVLRMGYDKTAIDDIARAAHVAKGTIYLHWKTRDALFVALMLRERLGLLEDVQAALKDTEEDVGLRDLFLGFARSMVERPLLRAALLGDREILGRLARSSRRDTPQAVAWRSLFTDYLVALRQLRAIRSDQTEADQFNIVLYAFMGGFFVGPIMPGELHVDDERIAELIADMIDRSLGTGRPLSRRATRAITRTTKGYIDDALVVARQLFDEALGLPEAAPEGDAR